MIESVRTLPEEERCIFAKVLHKVVQHDVHIVGRGDDSRKNRIKLKEDASEPTSRDLV